MRLGQATAYAFPSDSEASLELAFALLGRGVTVRREPVPTQPGSPFGAGSIVVGGADRATLATLAARFDTPVTAINAASLAGLVALHQPRVALLAPAVAPVSQFVSERGAPALSPAWARFMLERQLGLSVTPVTDSDVAGGRLTAGGFTHLIVAEGADASSGGDGAGGTAGSGGSGGAGGAVLSTAALSAVQAFVRAGGVYVGERGQGAAVAEAAGLTGARASAGPPELQVPGASMRITLDPSDPVAWGLGEQSFSFDNQDPVLTPGPASRVVARFPTGSTAYALGLHGGHPRTAGDRRHPR